MSNYVTEYRGTLMILVSFVLMIRGNSNTSTKLSRTEVYYFTTYKSMAVKVLRSTRC